MNAEARTTQQPRLVASCRCGARYEARAFERLDVVRVLEVDEIAPLVVRWPHGVSVDVRACASCATAIARLSRAR